MKEQLGTGNWETFEKKLDEVLHSTKEEASSLLQIASPGANIHE